MASICTSAVNPCPEEEWEGQCRGWSGHTSPCPEGSVGVWGRRNLVCPYWRCCSLSLLWEVSESLVWELHGPQEKNLNLFEGKCFVREEPGLNLCFVLKNNESNSCFIGNFIYKERIFLASRQNCSVAVKACYIQQVNFTTAKVLSIKCEILWFHKLNTAWNKRFFLFKRQIQKSADGKQNYLGVKKNQHRKIYSSEGKASVWKSLVPLVEMLFLHKSFMWFCLSYSLRARWLANEIERKDVKVIKKRKKTEHYFLHNM